LRIEKNIIVNDINKIKSILFSYFTKMDKAKISEGIQYNKIFSLNAESISLLYITCRRLIVIENGSKILRTSKKLYPNKRNVGVPIINNPIPNTD